MGQSSGLYIINKWLKLFAEKGIWSYEQVSDQHNSIFYFLNVDKAKPSTEPAANQEHRREINESNIYESEKFNFRMEEKN